MKQLYTQKWFWFLGALICAAIGIYSLFTFASFQNRTDLIEGILSLIIALFAGWRGLQPATELPHSDSERIL